MIINQNIDLTKTYTVKPRKLELQFFEILANLNKFETQWIQRIGPISELF